MEYLTQYLHFPHTWGENERERNYQCSVRTLVISLPRGVPWERMPDGNRSSRNTRPEIGSKPEWDPVNPANPQSTRIIVPSRPLGTFSSCFSTSLISKKNYFQFLIDPKTLALSTLHSRAHSPDIYSHYCLFPIQICTLLQIQTATQFLTYWKWKILECRPPQGLVSPLGIKPQL